MPRSKYVYFVRESDYVGSHHRLLGVFTVKGEANLWAFKHGWDPEHATLSRMRDGVGEDEYPETVIPWAEGVEGIDRGMVPVIPWVDGVEKVEGEAP